MKNILRVMLLVGLAVIGGTALWGLATSGLATLGLATRGFAQAQGAHDDALGDKTPDKTPNDKSDDDAEKPLKVAPRVSNSDGVPTITLDEAAASRSEIETLKLANAPHAQTLRAYGSVLDLQSLTDLANKYASAKAEMETQEAKRDLSKANVDRAHSLYTEGPQAISKAQLETAEESFRINEASLAAARSQLTTLAHTAIQAWGEVLGRGVAGSSTTSALLLSLIERRNVLIQVTLRADQRIASPPDDAFVDFANRRIALHFVSLSASTDPHIQGQSFYYTAAADTNLLPGMNVIAFVPTGENAPCVSVPASAIVWLQGRAWAYFKVAADARSDAQKSAPQKLVRREIPTDSPSPDGGYFVKDIPDGTEIVSRGAQMLLSEEFRAQIQSEE